jgi:hypothetical protein
MGRPTFVVAGAQKAATTWLYECFVEHPEVFVPEIKELHFFCDPGDCRKSRYGQGLDWYRSLFPDDATIRAAGELSIDYMFYPYVPKRLHALDPQLKIIFALRDPVERAYSAYWMGRRHNPSMPEFSTFLSTDSDYVARGFYFQQIQRYLELFPAENIKIMIYEDLLDDPVGYLVEICNFLGIDDRIRPHSLHQRIAETKAMHPALGRIFYKRLSPLLRRPLILRAWRMTKNLTGLKRRKPVEIKAPKKYPEMTDQDRLWLQNVYRDENARLFELLGRQVVEWQS